ncbi:ParB/RepB/Spo0J family partition protein [Streptomyces sp. NBC_01264]|uniref:ParB/RepB/Spo0J family partition protein n=1 Tax=Streptomyces sp. NBC_01264 TaxID=2903804 RepID=UPI002252E293|nr:ParB/RepB/Spo0J family partition protein [Streptomyces sp. NBC_01264]MCX4784286.1 ParB/RepB/Spo0J family partition protein [Streptomyces sp. NBC_01264]
MSKKDMLGRGSSFGSASGRSARRGAIDQTIGSGDTAGTNSLTDLPVPTISENPDNPRNHLRNLDDTVESVREVGVILPIVVGTVDAYLRSRPERAEDLDEGAQYVVIDGHRRLEAARRVGLATIPVRVDDARLSTDEKLLEAAFITNYHREDMTDLEEAHALKQLVEHYGGSQTRACKRLSMSPSTLSSKLSLLKLSPELQKDLMTGERRTEHVRNLSKLSPDAQKAKATERAAAAQERSRARHKPVSAPEEIHGVKSNEQVTDSRESIPEPRANPSATMSDRRPQDGPFPFHDGEAAAALLLAHMPQEERNKVCTMLLDGMEVEPSAIG